MERIRWWAGVSVFAVALYVVAFEVPFLFPPTEYLVSPSYAFGFNNAVAVLAIAGVLGAAALAYLVLGESRGPLVRYPTRPRRTMLKRRDRCHRGSSVCWPSRTPS